MPLGVARWLGPRRRATKTAAPRRVQPETRARRRRQARRPEPRPICPREAGGRGREIVFAESSGATLFASQGFSKFVYVARVTGTQRVLGVEGGGTKSAWMLIDADGAALRVVDRGKLPPANLRLTSLERLRAMLSELPRDVQRVGVFLAGCVTAEDNRVLQEVCAAVWPRADIVTGSDRESGIAAALGEGDGIVVNAGTGSSVTGRVSGAIERAAGW